MSLVVHDKIPVAYHLINYNFVERSNSEIMNNSSLCFMGDKKTKVYLLLANPNRKWLFSEKVSKVFPLDISLDSGIVLGVNNENEFYFNH